ncbi:MAG: hypothetical protein EAZ81_00265 [Verrucomicrobia bacterium]|nr:MAG: hypothetical protein EAZ81_00265 [Verrucomicrobiota bacterium]
MRFLTPQYWLQVSAPIKERASRFCAQYAMERLRSPYLSRCVPAFQEAEIRTIIDVLCRLGAHEQVFFAWRPFLPDPDDDLVLELAVAASAPYVITHNISDFTGSDSLGVQAITPAKALNLLRL